MPNILIGARDDPRLGYTSINASNSKRHRKWLLMFVLGFLVAQFYYTSDSLSIF